MAGQAVHNFHVPLPQRLYQQLRLEAARTKQPATALAREAITWWLQAQEKAALHKAIVSYAAQHAGTKADLDELLEAASVEHLLHKESEV